MTTPTKPTFLSGDALRPTPSTQDFGPDFNATKDDPQPPKINQRNPPKPSPLSNLGQNKKLRSPIRKLSEEDEQTLANWYRRIGKVAKVIKPQLGIAVIEQADDCAHSWCELAANNDKVRRGILAIVEGGDWTKLIAAHVPILIAVVPEATVERIMLRGMGLFSAFVQSDDEPTDTNDLDFAER